MTQDAAPSSSSQAMRARRFSATAFAFGADALSDYEYSEIGVTWENMHEGDFSLADSMLVAIQALRRSLAAGFLAGAWRAGPRGVNVNLGCTEC